MADFTELRLNLLRRGYVPLPLTGKAPKIPEWQHIQPDEEMIRSWARDYPNLTNTGIRATETPCIDINILDADAVKAITGMLRTGQELLFRTGRAPKVAIPLRAEQPFNKIVHEYRDPDGRSHKIEILARGQQLAAYGIHPDTKQPFLWSPKGPANVDRDELPELTESGAREFLHYCDDLLRRRGWEIPKPAPAPVSIAFTRPKLIRPGEARRAFERELDKVAYAVNTTRNDQLFKAAARLYEYVAACELPEGAVYDGLLDAARRCGLLQEESKKTLTTIMSARKRGLTGGRRGRR